jgi:hypothetical protein
MQLVAWLDALSRVQTISLDKLREHVFGYGRADEDATPKKLQDALDSAKKEIRRQLRQATQQVNQEAGGGGHLAPPGHLCHQEQTLRALGDMPRRGSRTD